MDFDGDGILDLVSGSYDPGEFYLFRGKGNGEYAARETICDKNGKPVLTKPDQKAKHESFGTWVALADWNNSGKLDLVLGCYQGGMLVRLNEGTRTKPAYATDSIPVLADGKPLAVPGHHASPVIADWDGDGLWDILSGSGNGGVYFCRNVGKLGEPKFVKPVALVSPHDGDGYNEFLDVTDEPKPGIRAQIGVCDFNGDGKLDLLVGDFCTCVSPRKDLTVEEREKLKAVRKKMAEVGEVMKKHRERINEELQKVFKSIPPEEITKEANQKKIREKQKELSDVPEVKNVSDELGKLNKEFNKFLEKPKAPRFGGDDMAVCHGYVWLFLRK